MFKLLEEPTDPDAVIPFPTEPTGYIFFDVDGTLIDYEDQPRWDVIDMLRSFHALGYQVSVWSGGGASYAGSVVRRLGLTNLVTHITAKDKTCPAPLAVDDEPLASWPDTYVIRV